MIGGRFPPTAPPSPLYLEAANARRKAELRDHFAGLAMQALIAKTPCIPPGTMSVEKAHELQRSIAIGAYDMADAMLAKRSL